MTEDTKNTRLSRREELASDGVLMDVYGKDWFLKVREALAIGLIQFSFVKKGDAKANHFDIYMDYDRFRAWVNDFTRDSRRGQQILAAEKADGEKYPKYYKYVTGTNGSKSVGFANSSTEGAIVINGRVAPEGGKAVYANIPVTNPDAFFESLSFWLSVIDGRVTPRKGTYLDRIAKAYEAAAKEREKHFSAPDADTTEYASEDTEDTATNSFSDALPGTGEASATSSMTPPESPSPAEPGKPAEKAKKERKVMNFLTDGEFFHIDSDADKAEADRVTKVRAHAFVSDKQVEQAFSEIVFYKTQRQKAADWYDRLSKAAAEKPVRIRVTVTPCGERDGMAQYTFQGKAPVK